MLSIEETRKYLKGRDLTDKQVEEIRNGLYSAVNDILDEMYENDPTKSTE
jgi:hypothetical protein